MTGPTATKAAKDKRAELANGRSQERQRQPALAGPQADILALQRVAGNQAIGRLLRSDTEITVSQPSDAHEREASQVADDVARKSDFIWLHKSLYL